MFRGAPWIARTEQSEVPTSALQLHVNRRPRVEEQQSAILVLTIPNRDWYFTTHAVQCR